MKAVATLLMILSILQAAEPEKDIRYIGDDGKTTTYKIVCDDGRSGTVSVNDTTKEMSIGSENLGRVTMDVVVKRICD